MWIFKKYGNRMIVALVTIILIVIIGLTAKGRDNLTIIENKIGNIITPVQKIFYTTGKKISESFNNIANFVNLKEENEELKKEIAKLQEKNRRYEDIIGKYEFLKNEALLKEKSKYQLINARVVGKDPGNWFDRVLIDKGINDGVKKGSIVVQAVEIEDNIVIEGLVGRVIDAGDNWAKVVTIIDEISNVSFKVIRTQDGGIAKGSVDSLLGGYLFDNKADVVTGDRLVTSGLGEVYVEDIYIGEIIDVSQKNDDLIKTVSIKPAVDFKKLYKVYVLLN